MYSDFSRRAAFYLLDELDCRRAAAGRILLPMAIWLAWRNFDILLIDDDFARRRCRRRASAFCSSRTSRLKARYAREKCRGFVIFASARRFSLSFNMHWVAWAGLMRGRRR